MKKEKKEETISKEIRKLYALCDKDGTRIRLTRNAIVGGEDARITAVLERTDSRRGLTVHVRFLGKARASFRSTVLGAWPSGDEKDDFDRVFSGFMAGVLSMAAKAVEDR